MTVGKRYLPIEEIARLEKLQDKEKGIFALWQKIMEVSKTDCKTIFSVFAIKLSPIYR